LADKASRIYEKLPIKTFGDHVVRRWFESTQQHHLAKLPRAVPANLVDNYSHLADNSCLGHATRPCLD